MWKKVKSGFKRQQTADGVTDESVIKKCAPCLVEGRQSLIHCFCITCSELLCKKCSGEHRKIKLTRNHVLLEGDDLPDDISIFKEMSKLGHCKSHTEREIEFKCTNHDEFICSLCIRDSHRNCNDLKPINTLICDRNTLQRDNVVKIAQMKGTVEKERKTISTNGLKIDDGITKVEQEMDEIADDLKSLIRVFDTEFRKNAKEMMMKIKSVETDTSNYDDFIEMINVHEKLMETTFQHGTALQLMALDRVIDKDACSVKRFIENTNRSGLSSRAFADLESQLKVIQSKMTSFKDICRNINWTTSEAEETEGTAAAVKESGVKAKILQPDNDGDASPAVGKGNETKDITATSANTAHHDSSPDSFKSGIKFEKDFKLDEDDEQLMGSDSVIDYVQSIAKKNKTEAKKCSKDTKVPADPLRKSDMLLQDCRAQKVNKYRISLQSHSSQVCDHIASVAFEDGLMMFIDANNKVLKLISTTFQVCSSFIMRSRPLDLSLLHDDSIAVATNIGVIIFSVNSSSNNTIEQRKIIRTKGNPCSVSPIDDNIAILFSDKDVDNTETVIQVRNSQNKILGKMCNIRDKRNRPLSLVNPTLFRSRPSSDFVIADRKRLSLFAKDGGMKWYYNPRNLENVEYVAFDTQENIYICDEHAGKIHQIPPDAYDKGRIFISGLSKPCSVLFNPKLKALVVGCADDNFVHVYKLVK